MTALANLMARTVWRAMLWLMRRNWMKQFQNRSVLIFPEHMRAKARIGLVKQNKFARKIGLPMLTFMMSLVIGSILITGTFFVAMALYDQGYLSVPRRIRQRMGE